VPTGVPLKIIGPTGEDLHVGFDLAPGTTMDQAHALARAMNSRITHIALLSLGEGPAEMLPASRARQIHPLPPVFFVTP
jgi:hypothetical protein